MIELKKYPIKKDGLTLLDNNASGLYLRMLEEKKTNPLSFNPVNSGFHTGFASVNEIINFV